MPFQSASIATVAISPLAIVAAIGNCTFAKAPELALLPTSPAFAAPTIVAVSVTEADEAERAYVLVRRRLVKEHLGVGGQRINHQYPFGV